ncbi:hypothetical protein KAU88_06720 [Candidatus Bathyarchaeota archaeon]|nr:hypothetical protein [Candidatus Bathyarchaeota archaeon]
MSKKAPRFELVKSPEYKVVHIDGVFGGVDHIEGRMIFNLDRLELKMKSGGRPGEMETDHIVRELLLEVRMSPLEFKNISDWMAASVKRLEKSGYKFPKPTKLRAKTSYVA